MWLGEHNASAKLQVMGVFCSAIAVVVGVFVRVGVDAVFDVCM